MLRDFERYIKLRYIYRAANFSELTWYMLWCEHDQFWKRYYVPSDKVPRNGLILDAGAGEGESILFLSRLGFHHFVAIEPDARKHERLAHNTAHLHVRIEKRNLIPEDLTGVDFAKIDVDGGEECLLSIEEPPCEIVLEIHTDDLLKKFKSKWPELKLLTKMPVQSIYLTEVVGRR